MDWQERLIILFSCMDKQFTSRLCVCAERMNNSSKPRFSDSEAVTVYLWRIMNGHRKVKPVYGYVLRNHLKEWASKTSRICGVYPTAEPSPAGFCRTAFCHSE